MCLFRQMGTQRLLVAMDATASLASSFDMSCSALSIPQVPWPIDQLKRKPRNRMAPGYICFQLYELQAGLIVSSIQRVADEGKCYSSRKPN